MPILVMAMLALVVFGLIGIMLVVAVMMEHSVPPRPTRLIAVPPEIIPSFNPKAGQDRGEDAPAVSPSTKEKVHEHACT